MGTPNNIVNGTAGDDLIDLDYTDADGEILDQYFLTNNTGTVASSVDAGAGDDIIQYASAYGTYSILGGDGNDYISALSTSVSNDGLSIDYFANADYNFQGGYSVGAASTQSEIDQYFIGVSSNIINFHGGNGNDTIIATEQGWFDGGDGNDTLYISKYASNLEITGGTGSDNFIVEGYDNAIGDTNITITDFTIGEDTLIINGIEINGDVAGIGTPDIRDVVAVTEINGQISLDYIPFGDALPNQYSFLMDSPYPNNVGNYELIPQLASNQGPFEITPVGPGAYQHANDLIIQLNDPANPAVRQIILKDTTAQDFSDYYGNPANGVVDGSNGNDIIGANFQDISGESSTNGAETINAGDGDDQVYLYAGNDRAYGGAGNDELFGMKGHNLLLGGDGNDLIHSGRHSSTLYGENGDDHLIAQLDKGADHQMFGGQGADTFELLNASDTKTSDAHIWDFQVGQDILIIDGVAIDGFNLPADMAVTENQDGHAVLHFNDDDTLTLRYVSVLDFTGVAAPSPVAADGIVDGTLGDDLIDLNFDDISFESVTNQGQTADLVHGHDGDDTIYLYRGDDTAYGDAGDDTIYGMKGHNTLYGNDGNDTLYSGRNTSIMDGGTGNDTLVAQLQKGGDHEMTGGDGADIFDLVNASDSKTSSLLINDFTVGTDTLAINGTAIDGAALPADVTVTTNDAGFAVVHFNDDDFVILNDVTANQFLGLPEEDPADPAADLVFF